ncbi:hypothetical protein [Escherichia coli]|uniref:hypothetical protein n=1 Tax=Escherichia coli TaxID=562 RepID=UPI00191997D3|nr:hypothetical protein [Escherichia coli]CAD6037424.1 Uncharacterised protein [Escherichia coli]CAD6099556.1 Uncharacterised protein [Escherichia coli]CAD6175984.1 Uncharacterised protein [Escherichia coli]
MSDNENEIDRKDKPNSIFIILGIIITNAFVLLQVFPEYSFQPMGLVFYISIVILIFMDYNHLIDQGYEPKSSRYWVFIFGVLFFFVWIWKRYSLIGDKTRLLFWVLTFSISASIYYAYTTNYNQIISNQACELTTKILHEKLNQPDAKCTRVIRLEKMSSNYYKATAILNNGTLRRITIDTYSDGGNDMMYINLLPPYDY